MSTPLFSGFPPTRPMARDPRRRSRAAREARDQRVQRRLWWVEVALAVTVAVLGSWWLTREPDAASNTRQTLSAACSNAGAHPSQPAADGSDCGPGSRPLTGSHGQRGPH